MSYSSSIRRRDDPTHPSEVDGSSWKRQRFNDGDRNGHRGYRTSQPSGSRGYSYRDEFAPDDGVVHNAERKYSKWVCSECKSENIDAGDDYCSICRTYTRRDDRLSRARSSSHEFYDNRSRHSRERYRFDSHSRHSDQRYHRDDRHYDNSYPESAASSDAPMPSSSAVKWPPLFETDGAAYVFDARSGLFYEGHSDFFFDPKTKLYFGNKQQLYYMHCPGEQPAFVAVQNCENTAPTETPQQEAPLGDTEVKEPSTVDTTVSSAPHKNKIAISIGTKDLSKVPQEAKHNDDTAAEAHEETPGTQKVAIEIFPIQKKICTADIEKWSKRAEEIRVQPEPEGIAKQQLSEPSLSPNVSDSLSGKICTTADGRPVCFLCKRKFASVEKLREHEMVSQLHKQNLSKVNEAVSSSMPEVGGYRDRAKERRAMFGEEHPKPKPTGGLITESPAVLEVAAPSPHENLGDGNIGNKLLQKLGWKEGASLGRHTGTVAAKDNTVGENLKQDWERIEAIASSEVKGRQTSMGIGRV